MLKDKLTWIILVVLGAAIINGLISLGRWQVQSAWDAEKDATALEVTRLKGEVALKEEQHANKVKEITAQLEKNQDEYQAALARNSHEYSERLLTIQKRADVYERFSQGTASQRNDLAKHATELDRSLEEGRALVQELGVTIGQRDSAIRALGSMILTDRNLIN